MPCVHVHTFNMYLQVDVQQRDRVEQGLHLLVQQPPRKPTRKQGHWGLAPPPPPAPVLTAGGGVLLVLVVRVLLLGLGGIVLEGGEEPEEGLDVQLCVVVWLCL